jgi:hypothetical protein
MESESACSCAMSFGIKTHALLQEAHTGRTHAQATTAHAQFVAQFLNTVVVGVRTLADALAERASLRLKVLLGMCALQRDM